MKNIDHENIDRETTAALMLAALGNETRLRLFRLLVRKGPAGLTVGGIQAELEMPASTLAHHLNALVGAGLVTQQRQGREVRNSAKYTAMEDLIAYLTEACCADAANPAAASSTDEKSTPTRIAALDKDLIR